MRQEVDLSGSWLGTLNFPAASLSGQATLSIAGDQLTVVVGDIIAEFATMRTVGANAEEAPATGTLHGWVNHSAIRMNGTKI